MIYAVDFDGTLCQNEYPQIGEPIQEVIDFIKKVKLEGHQLILWTCRTGENLKCAVDWSEKQGIVFDAMNENLPQILDAFELDSRKIFANYYIDDRNLFIGIEEGEK